MAVHCRLSAIMGERRLKQLDVVRGTGLAKATVGALYHDKVKKVDYGAIDKLCSFLGVDVGDILYYVPDGQDSSQQEPAGREREEKK